MTDHAPMKLEKYYTCWKERRWHTPKKSPYPRLTTGLLVSNGGISDVAIISVHAEKTRMKKMIMIIIIINSSMNKSQETTVFHGRQKLTRYEIKARKVMVDFKFDALYSYVFIKSFLKSG